MACNGAGKMRFEGDFTPANSEGPESCSRQPTSSVSASHTSPSIPAEGDWLEASDLDGERWIEADDMEALWGQDAPLVLASNATSAGFPVLSAGAAVPLGQHHVDEPSPKRLRLSSSPLRVKASDTHSTGPSVAAHHAMIAVPHPVDALQTSRLASREDTMFTDPNAAIESEDDTGSSGDVSASLRPMHATGQQPASSQHSAGSASDLDEADDPDFNEATQASSQGADSDNGSESSDGFEGMPSRYCINCMSRMYLGEVLCLVRESACCTEHNAWCGFLCWQCSRYGILLACKLN